MRSESASHLRLSKLTEAEIPLSPKQFHNSNLEQAVFISLTFSELPENAPVALSSERLHHRGNCWYLYARSECQRAACDDALI